MFSVNTIIVGASAAGLACAAYLKKHGITYVLLEQHTHVGHSWRNHYECLQLHTPKSSSKLPFLKFPPSVSKYPSREAFIAYLEEYTQKLDLQPRFGEKVARISKKDSYWIVTTGRQTYQAKHVIVATGYNNQINTPHLEGIESFPGLVLHSSAYKNGKTFTEQKVLVVGFGNSACDIAICLQAHGAKTSMSVRGPVNIIPRDILGIPILKLAILQGFLPAKIVDTLNMPLLRIITGSLTKFGLKEAHYGAAEQIAKEQKIPVLDAGIVRKIKDGKITIYPAIKQISSKTVVFENGLVNDFDVILLATGYRPAAGQLLQGVNEFAVDQEKSFKSGQEIGDSGLFFCGFYVSPTGMLREIGIEAKRIAQAIKAKTIFI